MAKNALLWTRKKIVNPCKMACQNVLTPIITRLRASRMQIMRFLLSPNKRRSLKGAALLWELRRKRKILDFPWLTRVKFKFKLGYDEPFISKFKYYLSISKLDFSILNRSSKEECLRELFDSYPIYLQHTLFYKSEDYKKVRGLECCSRFMAFEELRERGNKKYNKGKLS